MRARHRRAARAGGHALGQLGRDQPCTASTPSTSAASARRRRARRAGVALRRREPCLAQRQRGLPAACRRAASCTGAAGRRVGRQRAATASARAGRAPPAARPARRGGSTRSASSSRRRRQPSTASSSSPAASPAASAAPPRSTCVTFTPVSALSLTPQAQALRQRRRLLPASSTPALGQQLLQRQLAGAVHPVGQLLAHTSGRPPAASAAAMSASRDRPAAAALPQRGASRVERALPSRRRLRSSASATSEPLV